jgi:hypothetical protein
MSDKINKFNKHKNDRTLSLNEDRGDSTWQEERGERYGNSRKGRAKKKPQRQRINRKKFKIETINIIEDENE